MREKQINESRYLIVKGFFSLLKNKDYKKITMSDISKEAEVSRMTLYRHFENKEDILSYYMKEMIKSIVDKAHSIDKNSISTLLLIRNETIYKNDYLKLAFANADVEDIIKEIIVQNRELYKEYFPVNKTFNKYLRLFVTGGIDSITKEWILSGMKEPPEVITENIMLIINMLRSVEK